MFLFRTIAARCCRYLSLGAVILTACTTTPAELPNPLQSSIATPIVTKPPAATPMPAGSVVAVTFTPGPIQAPQSTPVTPAPTSAIAPTPSRREAVPNADSVTPTQTLTPGPTPTLGTPGTPDTRLTSISVIATITALAATPTYPPTDRPRSPTRRAPVVIGAAGDKVPPTTAPSKTGVTVLSLSERIFPGGTASLSIKTKAQAVCELSSIISSASGANNDVLQPIASGATRTAGSDGVIAWIWTIDANTGAGTLRLVIDCREAGVNQVQMTVTT